MEFKPDAMQKIAMPLFIACVVAACYASVVTHRYGFYDDYTWLNGTGFGAVFAQGRPLNGLFLDLGFSWAKYSIDKLAILRAVSLFGIWCLGSGIYFFCRAHRLATVSSLALASGIILLPSFQVYAAWAITYFIPFSALLALAAAYLLTPACSLLAGNRSGRIALAMILLLSALLIYQPTAMFFCAALALSMIASVSAERAWRSRQFSAAAITLGTVLGLGFLVQRAGLMYAGIAPSGGRGDRLALVQDLAGKLAWFVWELLPNAFSLYVVPGAILVSACVSLLVILGAVLFCRKHGRPAWLALAGAGVCLIVAAIPNLATAENWATYRSITAVSSVVAVVAILMAREIGIWGAGLVVQARVKKALLLAPAMFIALAGYSAYSNVLNGFVRPNVALLEALEKKVKESGRPARVVIRLLEKRYPASPVYAYDEFGFFMSLIEPPTVGMVRLALRDAGLRPNGAGAPDIVLEKDLAARDRQKRNDLLLDFKWISLCSLKGFKDSAKDFFQPINLNNDSWQGGIWRGAGSAERFSFVYYSKKSCSDFDVRTGDVLRFNKSGVRHVLKVDVDEPPYVVVLVDGQPLSVEDGYPNLITREAR